MKEVKKETTEKVKVTTNQRIKSLINWVDTHILPFVALVGLSGLAVKGLMVYLPAMSETVRMVASIVAISLLVVKIKSDS